MCIVQQGPCSRTGARGCNSSLGSCVGNSKRMTREDGGVTTRLANPCMQIQCSRVAEPLKLSLSVPCFAAILEGALIHLLTERAPQAMPNAAFSRCENFTPSLRKSRFDHIIRDLCQWNCDITRSKNGENQCNLRGDVHIVRRNVSKEISRANEQFS
jgi:hypothetical protein